MLFNKETMKLTFSERIFLSLLLPKQGTVQTLRLSKDILQKLELTDEEAARHQVQRLPDGNLNWTDGHVEYEIALNDMEQGFIAGMLTDASLNKRLGIHLLEAYDKFFPSAGK